jgi:hypothetical protein
MTDLALDAAGGASLEVAPADAKQSAPSAGRNAPVEWSVSVVPRDEGELQLKITVDGGIEGVRQARSIVAAIRVGGQGVDKEAAAAAAGSGAAAAAAAADAADAKSSSPQAPDRPDDGARQGDGLIHLHSDE